MRIGGLQRLTLLDYPGKVACTVFLSGCNLRCPYCHNPGLVLPSGEDGPELAEEELFDFLKRRRGLLDGVCVTGGEPTLNPELPQLLKELRGMGYAVKLDTNGTNPGMLREILRDGLADYVAMDIKNSPARYRETCGGVDVLRQAEESARILMEGEADYEFRTTVCKPLHTPQEMEEIGRWLCGAKRYFLQRFVDSGRLLGGGVQPPAPEEMELLRQAVLPNIPNARIRGS